MNTTIRFNITLPKDIGAKLKAQKNYSQVIAESLRETFAKEEKARLENQLLKAYRQAATEDKALADEWSATSGDGVD